MNKKMMEEQMILSRNEFLTKMRGHVVDWTSKDIEPSAKFEGMVRSLLQTLDSKYILAPIDEYTNLDDILNISGMLEERYLDSEKISPDKKIIEAQEELLEDIKGLKYYWENLLGDYSTEYRLSGLMFSLMVMLDGNITNYFLSKAPLNIDIAGELHERFGEKTE